MTGTYIVGEVQPLLWRLTAKKIPTKSAGNFHRSSWVGRYWIYTFHRKGSGRLDIGTERLVSVAITPQIYNA